MHRICYILIALLIFSSCGSIRHIHSEVTRFQTEFDTNSVHILPHDQLSRSYHGNWQLRISGQNFDLGYKKGKLTRALFQHQEDVFFQRVSELVPKPGRQRFLIRFLKWYHRNILKDIPLEYRKEIYGLSLNAGEQHNYIATKYERNLLLHGAHDIGHAMQDLMLVGCSSIALWDEYTPDGKLLIGRNFDFYVNDAFAENKVVEFIIPDKGYKYAAVSWPGIIGVVSGMNEKGLTITINAGKSSIPLKGKTPIMLVARDILQYAQNIQEAIEIASHYEVFVSESLLIGSAQDNKAVNIEISPKKFGVYETENGKLFCTNHFQSATYAKDKRNQRQIANSHSQYRLHKLQEIFSIPATYKPIDIAQILRDKSGLKQENIGLGNEKSLNQLLAHHGVIFKPDELLMWVSNTPYQLGTFEAYNLNHAFQLQQNINPITNLEIPADTFLNSPSFTKYQKYKELLPKLEQSIRQKQSIPEGELMQWEQCNPELWFTHKLLGAYYYSQQNWEKAVYHYEIALSKEISTSKAKRQIQKQLKKARRKI